jgi:hypothetical protein
MAAFTGDVALPGEASAAGWSGYVTINDRYERQGPWPVITHDQVTHWRTTYFFRRNRVVLDTGPSPHSRTWRQKVRWQGSFSDTVANNYPGFPCTQTKTASGGGDGLIARVDLDDSSGPMKLHTRSYESVPLGGVNTMPGTAKVFGCGDPTLVEGYKQEACATITAAPAPTGMNTITAQASFTRSSNSATWCNGSIGQVPGATYGGRVSYYLTRDPDPPECANGRDDDGNGKTDYGGGDRGCTSPTDNDEADTGLDSDHDGLTDAEELDRYGTNPENRDTDDDGLWDGREVELGTNPRVGGHDTDGDGLWDGAEVHQHGTKPLKRDTDGDGLSDGREVAIGTDPLNPRDPGGDGPCTGEDARFGYFTTSYTARIVNQHWPDSQLFHFSPHLRYCYDGRSSKVLGPVGAFHDIESGFVPGALDALGFELTYDESTLNPTAVGNRATITGGTFNARFHWLAFLNVVGARAIGGKVLGKLGPKLDEIIEDQGWVSHDLGRSIYVALGNTRAIMLKAMRERLSTFFTYLPGGIAAWLRTQIERRVTRAFDKSSDAVTLALSQNSFLGYTGKRITEIVADGLFRALEDDVATDFPIWTPRVYVVVTSSGRVFRSFNPLLQLHSLVVGSWGGN